MKSPTRLITFAVVLFLIAPSAAWADPGTGARPSEASVPTYMALGDSLAVGVGASDPSRTGYVPLFHDYLRENLDCTPGAGAHCAQLDLNNLGFGGATTTTLVQRQLPTALAELQARNQDDNARNDVEVITIDIGGNDVFPLVNVCGGGFTTQCATAIQSTFTTVAQNMALTLGQLRAAAGSDTDIIVMTYYNSLVGCQLSALAPLGNVVLEGQPGVLPAGLNDIIRSLAASVGASVAETFGQLGPSDLVGGADCLHPNDAGYSKLATAFGAAF